MKSFWFAFNPADWLSAKAVRMMSLAERGAYIGLLATAWGEERPGTLPADEDEFRRLAEMSPAEWAVSSRVLLAVFPLSDCGTYRYNPRLLEEAGKRGELVEKKAEAGRKSAERRARLATQGQQSANTIPTGVENNPTGVAEKGNQLQSQLQLHSSNEEKKQASSAGEELASPLPGPIPTPDGAGGGAPAKARLYRYDEAPVFLAKNFRAFLAEIGYPQVEAALYLLRISAGAREAVEARRRPELAPEAKWKAFIQVWLDNDRKNNTLLLPVAPTATGYPAPLLPAAAALVASSSYSPAAIAARNQVRF